MVESDKFIRQIAALMSTPEADVIYSGVEYADNQQFVT